MKSKTFTLNARDIIRSVVLFFITTIITGIYQLIQASGGFTWENVKVVLLTAISATLSYLVKNFLTNSEDKFLKTE